MGKPQLDQKPELYHRRTAPGVTKETGSKAATETTGKTDPVTETDIWSELTAFIRAGFKDNGYAQSEAIHAADVAVDAIYREYAGSRIGYFPKRRKAEREKMKQRLIADYRSGVPVAKLVNRYAVSRSTVYEEIRRRIVNIR